MMLVHVYTKQTEKGLGLFTPLPIKKGTRIWAPILLDFDVSKYPSEYLEKYATYDETGRMFVCTDLAGFTNHSCEPNTDGEIALREIEKDEELTYDYSLDWCPPDDNWSFECKCGSANCRGIIKVMEMLPQ